MPINSLKLSVEPVTVLYESYKWKSSPIFSSFSYSGHSESKNSDIVKHSGESRMSFEIFFKCSTKNFPARREGKTKQVSEMLAPCCL